MPESSEQLIQRLFAAQEGRINRAMTHTWNRDVMRGFVLGMQMAMMEPEWTQAFTQVMAAEVSPDNAAMMRAAARTITERVPIDGRQ